MVDILGTNNPDVLVGTGKDDVIFGKSGNDVLEGRGGNDKLYGQDQNDRLIGGAGGDILVGGLGFDTVDYSGSLAGIVVDMADKSLGTGDAAGDVFGEVEAIAGSNFGDRITGDANPNVLSGLGGDDTLDGGVGAVFDPDTLDGGAGNDVLLGRDGSDFLRGGAGADVLNGGAGTDRAQYDISGPGPVAGVAIDLKAGTASGGEAAGDVLVSIEHLIGSKAADILKGTDEENELHGSDGDDTISGRGGVDDLFGGEGTDTIAGGAGDDIVSGAGGDDVLNAGDGNDSVAGGLGRDVLNGGSESDILSGGADADALTGGTGADGFVWNDASESRAGALDVVQDFSRAEGDILDLMAVDADSGSAGDQSFTFIGATAFTGVGGQLRYAVFEGDTYVLADVNGDRAADLRIRVLGEVVFVDGDFLL
jgi:Ca2+-binding RTX toxin-like protein